MEEESNCVRMGRKRPRLVKGKDCLICSDGFTNGVCGVNWLGATGKVFLYQESVDDGFVEKVLQSEVVLVNRKEAILKLENLHTISIVVGSLTFVDALCKDRNVFPLIQTVVLIPYNRFRKGELVKCGFRWTKVTHAMVGGVTATAWSIGVPKRFEKMDISSLSPSFQLKRYLKHVVKDGEMGEAVAPPIEANLNRLITMNELKHGEFLLPSFRSCTGWVKRTLVPFERGLCLDFNELVMHRLLHHTSSMFNEVVLSAFPGKVLQLLHEWIGVHWGEAVVQAEMSVGKPDPLERGKLLIQRPVGLNLDQKLTKDEEFLAREASYLVDYGQKASKSDNASIPIELWDRCVLRNHFDWLSYTDTVAKALDTLRTKFAWRIYAINLVRSFFRYLTKTYGDKWWRMCKTQTDRARELKADLRVGLDVLRRGLNSSWWEWLDGSTCSFWRWPVEIRKDIRDGFAVFVEKKLPEYKKRQTFKGLNEVQLIALEGKIHKVINRKYLNDGYVKSLINYFAVPKGADDIRVVYDGTKSGLTDAVWAPNFFMPSVDSLLLYCSPNTWYSDLDLGEMFLNYFMDPVLRPYCGVDVSRFAPWESSNNSTRWMQWNRMFMGFRSSPYYAVKIFSWCLDLVRGDHRDASNPFAFDRIRLNLPGSLNYTSCLPWVSKMQQNKEASDVVPYMDDGRPHGGSERGCRLAGKRTSKITQYLGQQDASRKYRPPSQEPGPWCGAFIASRNGSLWAYVSDEKWNKAKAYVQKWEDELAWCLNHNTPLVLNFKELERGRGFLVYLSRTYPSIVPYLKGIHLTLDSWRPNRDAQGWKQKKVDSTIVEDLEDIYDHDEGVGEDEILQCLDKNGNLKHGPNLYENHPDKVCTVPRLEDDLNALSQFFSSDKPTWRFVRGSEICVAEYGFGDASGSGFGSSFQTASGIEYRFGVWGRDGQGESSNFRELSNLVDALYARVTETGTKLTGLEVFLFTDNVVAEGAFYKGTSSSKKLFKLVLKLRLLEMKEGCRVHIIHIAGTRMIWQGTDGLSRGDVNEGVMVGKSMLEFVPLHKTCLERSPLLKPQLRYCLQSYADMLGQKILFLSELDWYLKGHDLREGELNADKIWMPKFQSGVYIWSPAPSAGQHAIEQMRQARLKRTTSTHIYIIPRIFTSLWRKQLFKCSDLVIEMPFDNKLWTKETHHEPLTIALLFPFLPFKPWQLKRSFAFMGMGRVLRRMWQEGYFSQWDILRELFVWTGRLSTMPSNMVWQMLQSASNFEVFCGKTRK